MTNTGITTAARRIARELNTLPAHVTVSFTADGQVIDRVYGQSMDASHLGRDAAAVHIVPSRPDSFGGRWTQRGVQTFLDETAEMDAAHATVELDA